ncbi:MAG: ATPase AAA [Nitrospirales bacterium]|nr:MAG: ATPase AAA [Nitrospirales bacterium]
MKSQLLQHVIDHYLNSGDFNGIPYSSLLEKLVIQETQIFSVLLELIAEDQIEIMYGDYHPNPHIKAWAGKDKEGQLDKLQNSQLLNQACVYPASKALADVSDIPEKYSGKPYSMELAFGAGQLDFRSFNLEILEMYRNDPRYHYDNDDISGWISASDGKSDGMASSDSVYLQTFGFSYTDDFDRAVAVYVRYLHDLSPEHQQMWKAKELQGDYKLHPDYHRNTMGHWGTKLSIFDAFTRELEVINQMCSKMNMPNLFKETFFEEQRPREFGFLLRPTLKEFNIFVELLDKMMSQNIKKDFFRGEIDLETEQERKDGKTIVSQKGTIQLLEEWIRKLFKPEDPKPLLALFSTFKDIRRLRQNPAHSVTENEFDQKYFKEQRHLIKKAFVAVRTIRLIFANHPMVRCDPPEINEFLFKGEIWDF